MNQSPLYSYLAKLAEKTGFFILFGNQSRKWITKVVIRRANNLSLEKFTEYRNYDEVLKQSSRSTLIMTT